MSSEFSATSVAGPLSEDAHFSNAILTAGLVSERDLCRARERCRGQALLLFSVLLDMAAVEEGELLPLFADSYGLPLYNAPSDSLIDKAAVSALGAGYLQAQQMVPLRGEDGSLCFLIADPARLHSVDEAAFVLNVPSAVGLTSATDLRRLVATLDEPPGETNSPGDHDAAGAHPERQQSARTDGPAVRFVADCLAEAIAKQASDIHFTSTESGLLVRLRVHGVLIRWPGGGDFAPEAVFARLKVLAGMNVAERRLPQDGRFTQAVAGRTINFRVSSIPTALGESIVVRPLDPKALRLGWDKLGFEPEIETQVREIIEQPSGLFLVTGPTGSGKTTTLYTAINHLNDGRRKIITVEDPVEYQIDGIDQMQVHSEIGLTFATALRAILRQDPNVILIGEIRDPETAEIACRAALVGRLVLSTMHTGSVHAAVTRLVDLGVEDFLVRDVLRGVLAQSLEITPCRICCGAGCQGCNYSGLEQRKLRAELSQK